MANVNVSCALPQGIKLELFNSTGGDGHYQSVVLTGSNSNWSGAQPFTPPGPGITSVDQAFITAWLAANAALPIVVSGLIALAS